MKTVLAAAVIALAPSLAFAQDMHAFDYTGIGEPVALVASSSGPMIRTQAAPVAVKAPSAAFLTAHSDYTVFLKADVPLQIHRQAMRALWATNPQIGQAVGVDVVGYPTEPVRTTLAALQQ